MAAVDELIKFLRDRLNEREAKAKAADVKQGDPQWFVSPVAASWPRHFTVRSAQDKRPIAHVEDLAGDDEADAQGILDGSAVAEHIADNDPQFVLADVESKRQLLDWLSGELAVDYSNVSAPIGFQLRMTFTAALKVLALPWAGHPEFREDWKL